MKILLFFLAQFCCTLREEKKAFCCNFWRKKKLKFLRLLLLKLCEFAAGNFGGFAAIKGQQSAANLWRKIGAICCQFVQKNWSYLCRKIGAVCAGKIGAVCAEKLELFAANFCKKIGQHCAANLREKKQLGAAKFLRKRELKVLPPEEEENDPRKRGSHGGEERKTWW
ncbi:PREDICTED: uncharacterized protein LOC108660574 isoform X1 [Theobroma cacao]|uniref:Uncharacterized protein LOC108660574 isoform X1 n=1 Tax=Theobroma cacao TaxID=3641 RepID=A0AB32VVG4_THECC|nr:PREDICTED: uncharacterized protein LOC108660574 isoform X1 [Theobroma cacao]